MGLDEIARPRGRRSRSADRAPATHRVAFAVQPIAEALAIAALALAAGTFLLPGLANSFSRAVERLVGLELLAFSFAMLLLWRISAVATRVIEAHHVRSSKHGAPTHRPARLTVVATLTVLALGIGCSAFGAWRIYEGSRAADEIEFALNLDRVNTEIRSRLHRFHPVLRGVRGLYAASRSVERAEFAAFFAARNVGEEFRGAYGVGFIERMPREGLDRAIAALRADGAPGFSVRGAGERPELDVIKFIEPVASNATLIGYDIASEASGREAAEGAMQSGEPTLSYPMLPGFGERGRPTYLYLLAVYRTGTPPSAPEARSKELVGWACVPVAIDEVLAGVVDAVDDLLDVRVYEGDDPRSRSLLYDSRFDPNAVGATAVEASDAPRSYEKESIVSVGERELTTWVGSTARFDAARDQRSPILAGMGGALISALLALVTWGLGSGRARAMDLAASMTRDLRASDESARAAVARLESFREVLDRQVIIASTDVTGRITEVNELFCQISKYSRAELIGANHRVLTSGRHSREFWVEMWGRISKGRSWRGEVCNKAKDGTLYWVDTTIAPVRGANGKITGYIGVRVDISDRKRAERAVAESELKFRTLAEGTGVILWEFDTERDAFSYISPQAAWLGYPLEKWLEPHFWWTAIHPDDRKRTRSFWAAEVRAGLDHRITFRMLRADGGVVWVDDAVTVTRLESGETIVRGVLIDITEAQRQSEELNRALEAAESASRAKSEFLANMSHEIRTPMTAILGYADLLREEGDVARAPKRRLDVIDAINTASEHLMRVIDDILDLSKIEANRMSIERIETKLEQLLSEVAGLIRPRATEKGVELSLHFDTPLPERVLTDPTRLRQILLNLVGNAVKFTDAGGVSIRARTEERDGRARFLIDVEDTGRGLAADEVPRLFGAFSQADGTMARRYGGSGLGLMISRRLARLMGGDVTLVRSEPHRGSCFRVDIPVESVAGSATQAGAGAEQAAKSPGIEIATVSLRGRILLAEDCADIRHVIAYHLAKVGAEVDLAANGEIALAMLRAADDAGRPYDLLLSDMQMPGMDGYTLARTLRSRGSRLSIVALTAHAMAEDRHRCLEAGCDDYATKPIDKAVLLGMCAKWIGRKSAVSALSEPRPGGSALRAPSRSGDRSPE